MEVKWNKFEKMVKSINHYIVEYDNYYEVKKCMNDVFEQCNVGDKVIISFWNNKEDVFEKNADGRIIAITTGCDITDTRDVYDSEHENDKFINYITPRETTRCIMRACVEKMVDMDDIVDCTPYFKFECSAVKDL